MGNSPQAQHQLSKGEGFRIISIEPNSPLQHKLEPFFDFVIEATPLQPSHSPLQILDKLSPQNNKQAPKNILQILKENVDKPVKLKIVSTKYRNVRTVQLTIKQNQQNPNNVLGAFIRKQRYDEVFDSYCPITQILNNSPIRKSGIRDGQYLVGCIQYPYKNIDNFMQGVYERFFDKNILEKSIHLAVYDIASDVTLIREVVLSRGWGGKGLLGCQFSQGLLHKFPSNLEVIRKELQEKESHRKESEKLRQELGDCDGVSKTLVESLSLQKNKKGKNMRHIKSLLSGITQPNISTIYSRQMNNSQVVSERSNGSEGRVEQLERRVDKLQKVLFSITEYINKVQNQQSKQINL